MRVTSWVLVGALLTSVVALPLWSADGLFLDQPLVFLPARQFKLPILTLCFWLHELQSIPQIPQGTPSLRSARAPPLLAFV